MTAIDQELLRLLVCPESKAPVIQHGDWLYSTDRANPRRYPIRDGIPIMLVDESETVVAEELERVLKQASQP